MTVESNARPGLTQEQIQMAIEMYGWQMAMNLHSRGLLKETSTELNPTKRISLRQRLAQRLGALLGVEQRP